MTHEGMISAAFLIPFSGHLFLRLLLLFALHSLLERTHDESTFDFGNPIDEWMINQLDTDTMHFWAGWSCCLLHFLALHFVTQFYSVFV